MSDSVCVHSGLFVGKEGPMIHSGAVVGAGLSQVAHLTSSSHSQKLSFRPCLLKQYIVRPSVIIRVTL